VVKTVEGGRNARDGRRGKLEGLAQQRYGLLRSSLGNANSKEGAPESIRLECPAMFGAGPRWKYFSEAESLREDETT